MKELLFDYDEPHYACYEDYRPGTPETAYKLIADYPCRLKRGLDTMQLLLIRCLLDKLREHVLPGTRTGYACFCLSNMHTIQYGLESDAPGHYTAPLEVWEGYLDYIREVTGLPIRMGTAKEVLNYVQNCFDVMEVHPLEWGTLFAMEGEHHVSINVYDEIIHEMNPSCEMKGDILLVCDEIEITK